MRRVHSRIDKRAGRSFRSDIKAIARRPRRKMIDNVIPPCVSAKPKTLAPLLGDFKTPMPVGDFKGRVPLVFVILKINLCRIGERRSDTYHRNLSLRAGSGLPFVDLQGSPTVLIGAFDNYWTMSLARDLPFFFDRGGRIRERSGQHRVWSSVARADSTISEDYAVVFRLLDSNAGGPVIAIAGLTTCGTQAAAQFVTDPSQLKKLSGIPNNSLARKNLEFVLRASLVNCTPTSVDVIAQQVWWDYQTPAGTRDRQVREVKLLSEKRATGPLSSSKQN